jgi:mono/diheme cytochrome c family protein
VKREALLAAVAMVLAARLVHAETNPEARGRKHGLARAPESARGRINPYEGGLEAARAGGKLFRRHCVECHGEKAQGSRRAPSLASRRVRAAPAGDVFWFLTNGNLAAGMPSWSRLPEPQRWQIVTFLQQLDSRPSAAPAPQAAATP